MPEQPDPSRDSLAHAGLALGIRHFESGDYAQAAQCFDAALTLGARPSPMALAVQALCLSHTGDHRRARAACELAAALLVTHPETFAASSAVRKLLFEATRVLEAAERNSGHASVDLYTLRANKNGEQR